MSETDASKAFREAVVAHDLATRRTRDAANDLGERLTQEREARLAESRAKRALLKEARGVATLPRAKSEPA